MSKRKHHSYTPTEAQWKNGARAMYVTYDLPQTTKSGAERMYPKVKRVYVAGKIEDWTIGDFAKRTGRAVHGVRIAYQQGRASYTRRGYRAKRGGTIYRVPPVKVHAVASHFAKIVEVPDEAQNIQFRGRRLPKKYQSALQAVR